MAQVVEIIIAAFGGASAAAAGAVALSKLLIEHRLKKDMKLFEQTVEARFQQDMKFRSRR